MSLDNAMDDETWLREAQKRVAREKEKAAAMEKIAALDNRSKKQQPSSPAQAASSSYSVNEKKESSMPATPSPQQQQQSPYSGNAGATGSNAAFYVPPTWQSIPSPSSRGEDEQKSASFSMPLCGFAPPSERSFETFFKEWFTTVHFPAMSELLKAALVNRARDKGFFSGLSSQFKKWAMANTDPRLQCDVWFSYFTQSRSPIYSSYGPFRTAEVNLGAESKPCMATFYGYPDEHGGSWFLRPFSEHLGDMNAILDELDGQGGLSAFLSAAGTVATAD